MLNQTGRMRLCNQGPKFSRRGNAFKVEMSFAGPRTNTSCPVANTMERTEVNEYITAVRLRQGS